MENCKWQHWESVYNRWQRGDNHEVVDELEIIERVREKKLIDFLC